MKVHKPSDPEQESKQTPEGLSLHPPVFSVSSDAPLPPPPGGNAEVFQMKEEDPQSESGPEKAIVLVQGVALRRNPQKDPDDPHGNTLADLPQRHPVEILSEEKEWAKVRLDWQGQSLTGYVSRELIGRSPETQKESNDLVLQKSDLSSLFYIQSGGNLHILAVRDVVEAVAPQSEGIVIPKDKLRTSISELGAGQIENLYLIREEEPYFATTFALYEGKDSELFAGQSGEFLHKVAEMTSQAGIGDLPTYPYQPPGRMPTHFYEGIEAHKMIAKYYSDRHRGEEIYFNYTPVKTLLDRLDNRGIKPDSFEIGSKGLLRPDIANLSLLDLFEIKPITQQSQALAELNQYLSVFKSVGIPMKPGPSTDPGATGVTSGPSGWFQFFSPIPGVILYRYIRKEEKRQPQEEPQTVPQPQEEPKGFWKYMEEATGLTGATLVIYVLISEGSRIIPARNLIPIP